MTSKKAGLYSAIRKNYGNKENIKQNIQFENIENKTKNTWCLCQFTQNMLKCKKTKDRCKDEETKERSIV